MPVPNPATASEQSALPDLGAAWLVWGLWAVMLVSVFVFIRVFGANVPTWDEWTMVPPVTGHQSVDLPFLWSPHNEHRIPLPRLVYLGLARLAHGDFRAGMYLNGFVLGALAALLIGMARKLRGWTSYADAVFPLALLHLGHAENLLWSFQIQFASSTLLACGLLGLILRSRQPLTGRTGLAGGLLLILLPLCGANGLPFVLPLAGWLAYWAWRHRQAPGGGRNLLMVLSLDTAALVLIGAYFVHLSAPGSHPPAASLGERLRGTLQFLVMSGGPAAASFWPYSGYIIAVLVLVSLIVLLRTWFRQPEERVRALGLLGVLVAILGLAYGVAFGRIGLIANAGFTPRYTLLAVPLIWVAYFVAEIGGPPALARFGQTALFTLLGALCLTNLGSGLDLGRFKLRLYQAVEQDLVAHLPASMVAQKHAYLYPDQDFLVRCLEMLRQARVGKFRYLTPMPVLRGEELPHVPLASHQVAWEGSAGHFLDGASYVEFGLPRPRFVYGIQVTYTYAGKTGGIAPWRVSWKNSPLQDYSETARHFSLPLEVVPGRQQVVLFINDTIDRFRILPDTGPCVFEIVDLKLVFPQSDEPSPAQVAGRNPNLPAEKEKSMRVLSSR